MPLKILLLFWLHLFNVLPLWIIAVSIDKKVVSADFFLSGRSYGESLLCRNSALFYGFHRPCGWHRGWHKYYLSWCLRLIDIFSDYHNFLLLFLRNIHKKTLDCLLANIRKNCKNAMGAEIYDCVDKLCASRGMGVYSLRTFILIDILPNQFLQIKPALQNTSCHSIAYTFLLSRALGTLVS